MTNISRITSIYIILRIKSMAAVITLTKAAAPTSIKQSEIKSKTIISESFNTPEMCELYLPGSITFFF